MGKIIYSDWFTSMRDNIGMVLTENEVGKRKIYIGKVLGIHQGADESDIAVSGAKVNAKALENILKILKETDNYE